MWLSPCNAASCVAVAWMFGASAARAGGLTFDQAQRLALAGAPALVAAVARSEANPEELRPAGEQPDLQLALDVAIVAPRIAWTRATSFAVADAITSSGSMWAKRLLSCWKSWPNSSISVEAWIPSGTSTHS